MRTYFNNYFVTVFHAPCFENKKARDFTPEPNKRFI